MFSEYLSSLFLEKITEDPELNPIDWFQCRTMDETGLSTCKLSYFQAFGLSLSVPVGQKVVPNSWKVSFP